MVGEAAKERARRLYCMGLLELLTQADIHLLAKYESQILELEGLDLYVREAVTERDQTAFCRPRYVLERTGRVLRTGERPGSSSMTSVSATSIAWWKSSLVTAKPMPGGC